MNTVKQQVTATLQTLSSVNPIREEMTLREDLGLDSIRIITALTRLSRKLGVSILEFTDRDLLGLKTVNDLVLLFSGKETTAGTN
jgi:acyl carrier protein